MTVFFLNLLKCGEWAELKCHLSKASRCLVPWVTISFSLNVFKCKLGKVNFYIYLTTFYLLMLICNYSIIVK